MSTYTSSPVSDSETHNLVAEELGGNIPEADAGWINSLYEGLAKVASIDQYFGLSSEHKNGWWRRIPEAPTHISELYEPLRIVIDSIITHFGLSGVNGTREAVNTQNHAFKGPSFSVPDGAELGFSNATSCFAVRLDAEVTEAPDHAAQMTAYAKNIFIQQPNRIFVRTLLITQRRAFLFHFDRSGAQYSSPFNIHTEPHTFTRIILGLCAADERILGLDDSVQWVVGPDGKKLSGTLTTLTSDNTTITYDLIMNEDGFARRGLRGRGTICWVVQNAKKERFIVKDYWLADGRTPEFELLKEARGLSAVCQMVSYEENRAQTKAFRGDTNLFKQGSFQNRTAIRIVMKAYGRSAENFSSAQQFLAALRDAIAGHRSLLAKGVIHRDVSPNNILLGCPEADEGHRGVLIDLDIASKRDAPFDLIRADYKTGTRPFQSLMILKTSELDEEDIFAHDYLDDLESFFWVFSYILLTYKSNDPYWSYDVKFTFLHSTCTDKAIRRTIDEGWRPSCLDLFVKFREYMSDLFTEKKMLLFDVESDAKGGLPNRFSSVLAHVDEHYDHILALFDEALKKAQEGSKSPGAASTSGVQVGASDTTASEVAKALEPPAAPGQYFATSSQLPIITSPSGLLTSATISSTPSQTSSPDHPLAVSRGSKRRRSQDPELDEAPMDVKRVCSSSRGFGTAIIEPAVCALNSAYEYCIKWL
ncbi:hypothetical protein MD484_g3716, partial [Candolleomyces efflorescens]